MFGAGAAIRAIALVIVVGVLAGGLWYVSGLRADLAISQENSRKLADAVKEQREAMDNIRREQEKIRDINNELRTQNRLQDKDMENLRDRLTRSASGEKRELGKTASVKPLSVERAINRGTLNVMRCLEIASGAPLTEKEKNAKLPSEINKECPSMANPGYSSSAGQ